MNEKAVVVKCPVCGVPYIMQEYKTRTNVCPRCFEKVRKMDNEMRKCDCIIAFHRGHSEIRKSIATKECLEDSCCGGVLELNYCPVCGVKINWDKLRGKLK